MFESQTRFGRSVMIVLFGFSVLLLTGAVYYVAIGEHARAARAAGTGILGIAFWGFLVKDI